MIDNAVVQSQEDIRMKQESPLEVSKTEAILQQTQELKTAFIGDEAAVIHEVDEENNPEDAASEAQRHTILKEEQEEGAAVELS